MGQICEVLGFNKSTFYYQPGLTRLKQCCDLKYMLAAAHPTYGYRRITKVLVPKDTPLGINASPA